MGIRRKINFNKATLLNILRCVDLNSFEFKSYLFIEFYLENSKLAKFVFHWMINKDN